ncbi:MAG: prephenate dehydrogenase/arogenate dehydrogenase family protein [Microthrixaceae bacterium]
MTSPLMPARAAVIGIGLIGGSIAAALRVNGWHVSGTDNDRLRAERALELGVIDQIGDDPQAKITFVAVPVGSIAAAVEAALADGRVVTDVGSVKAPIVSAISDPRFVGGHPMAGSEAIGVEGARADLFQGATWVLTPTSSTDPDAHALVHSVVRSLGAEVLTLDPENHDRLVATVSHVPHLAAASLMGLAADRAVEHSALLRLAAGGFRDMTRIASGDPTMWIDICADNRDAILEVIDELTSKLSEMRDIVARGAGDALLERLSSAQDARRSLPTGVPEVDELAEVSVPIPDQPGELAAVTSLATQISANVYDIEVIHNAGETGGRLLLVVDAARAEDLAAALRTSGRSVTVRDVV